MDIARRGAQSKEALIHTADITAIKIVLKEKTILCKIPVHIRIKRNKEVDKTAKQAIDMPGTTTRRLPYTDYNLTIKRVSNSEW